MSCMQRDLREASKMDAGRPTRAIAWLLAAAALGLAVLNGRPFSPLFDPVLFWLGRLAGGGAAAGSAAVFHGTSAVVSLVTLGLAALPVLLLKAMWLRLPGVAAAALWLVFVAALSWPTLQVLLERD